MTNEEAIEVLAQDLPCETDEDLSEAMTMAIKALEQQPCEDAVSRQAVEKMIKAEMPERGMWEIEGDTIKETVCEVCVDLMQELSKLPPVTPKEKTGHWYIREMYSLECNSWECSECKEVIYEKTKYCPNCGARMVSE